MKKYQSTNTYQSTNDYKWANRIFVGIRSIWSIRRLGYCKKTLCRSKCAGFSLVEMMVAVALFAVVMLISTGALLSLVDANRKAQALQSVMDNLNIAVDGMVRTVRMGSVYNCGAQNAPSGGDGDCPGGGTLFSFLPEGGDPNIQSARYVYEFKATEGRLYRSTQGGQAGTFFAITAPEVTIDDMLFHVIGSKRGDDIQPKVVVTIRGTAGADKAKTATTFSMQSTASQRILDL